MSKYRFLLDSDQCGDYTLCYNSNIIIPFLNNNDKAQAVVYFKTKYWECMVIEEFRC